jgi:recombinational DNA repair protein (RecF pathway)
MMMLEVLSEAMRRLGYTDLLDKCEECVREVDAVEMPKQKEG